MDFHHQQQRGQRPPPPPRHHGPAQLPTNQGRAPVQRHPPSGAYPPYPGRPHNLRPGPRYSKGALVVIPAGSHSPTVIPFQYNPGSLTRQLQPQYFGADESAKSQTVRFSGPPVQQISAEIELDATDKLERGDRTAHQMGIHPELAALERLVYPDEGEANRMASLATWGSIEVAPIVTPLVLFVWGPRRIVPVRVESVQVSEQLFDTNLNPIQASVTLQMRVLTYADLEPSTTGYNLFVAYQNALGSMASHATTRSFVGILPADVARQL